MRSRVLDMCLKNLWRLTRAYIASGNLTPLPSYIFIAFTHPEITCRILEKGDISAHVTRRCVGALIVNKLAADINFSINLRLGTELSDDDAGTELPDDDAGTELPGDDTGAELPDEDVDSELGCLSSILHSENRDTRLCLTQPGVIELVNMIPFALGPVDSLGDNDLDNNVPLDSDDIVEQTLVILSQALPAQENADAHPDQMVTLSNVPDDRFQRTVVSRLHSFLEMCIQGASPLEEEVRTSGLRVSLKTLWYSGKAYHDASDSLPLYFPLVLSRPELTHRFQTERDPVVRITGCCFGALMASKLVDALSLESPISLSDHVDDAELACISAIIGTGHRGDLLLPHQLRVINLGKVVSLMLGEIDILFTTEGTPSSILDIAQDTLNVLADRLMDSNFVPQDLPMEQQWLLDDISSEVKLCSDDRLQDKLVNRLERLQQIIENLLPAVGPSQDAEMQNSVVREGVVRGSFTLATSKGFEETKRCF